jgi:hypothetical protein
LDLLFTAAVGAAASILALNDKNKNDKAKGNSEEENVLL